MSKATRRADLVGCNYPNTQLRLQGCVNDVLSMEELIVNEFGFDQHHVKYLIDEPGTSPEGLPTYANIMAALEEMVHDAVAGDVLFFHFSGHGTTLSSLKPGDSYKEEEAIVPCDLNLITNMDLRCLIQKLKPGTSFTILSDSCHSGGLIDKYKEQTGPTRMKGIPLPVYYKSRGISIGSIMNCLQSVTGALNTGANTLTGVANVANTGSTVTESISSALSGIFNKDVSIKFRPQNEQIPVMKSRSLMEDEGLLLSGCQANETSADLVGSSLTDGRAHGAFTYAVVKVLNQNKGLTNKELVKEVRRFLQDQGIEQHPCLYCSDGNADAPFLDTQNSCDRKKAPTDKHSAGEITRADADETPYAYQFGFTGKIHMSPALGIYCNGKFVQVEKQDFKMGNALRFLYGKCCKPSTTGDSDSVGPPYNTTAPGVSALAHDLFNFEITSQVPEDLGQHVVSSRKAQVKWYAKLLQAWKEAKPPPKTPEEVARLIVETLSKHQKADVEGLLEFYGLPHPPILVKISTGLPEGVEFEMHTLPVDGNTVPDGDGLNVYVDTADPRESSNVPRDVLMAAIRRSKAREKKNYARADELRQKIIEAGYQVINIQHEEILARKYRIRLRGIDAPENAMPYGKEAKQELVKLVNGKCLRVLVYGEDRYGRCVADVYCNGIFVQEVMLKKGLAWHYAAYDQRVELATWEKKARARKVGLWAQSNPEKPWEWRKDKREGR
ncbi:hypothetical protein V6N11_028388 [Hibiscus sabdariffa]|uniref:TNase-like domain-containing protein n=1 Tax=Hibiscus sabdariffa TaxID=183260 RepID=A0ABR2NQD4_9ROSI